MIGIDEVGRGCLAGPLLIVAARSSGDLPKGIKDSKQLSRAQREKLFKELELVCKFGEGWVSADEIDDIGLSSAMALGVERALIELMVDADENIVIDGSTNYVSKKYQNVECVIKADSLVPIVSAASIYAKVVRDAYMHELASKYPDYSFEKHVGYGTKLHMEAIEKLGAINSVHRFSFAPLKAL